MAAAIHKFLGWTFGLLFAVASAAVTFGGELVRQKIADAAGSIYADTEARTAVIVVLVLWAAAWFLTKPQIWAWIKSLCRPPPTVYLSNTELVAPTGDKMFFIQWIAEQLHLSFRGDGRGALDKNPSAEKNITFSLLNAGEKDIRNIEVRWILPEADIPALLDSSQLLGTAYKGINSQGLISLEISEGGSGTR